jgi:putative peptidoglycan lipid II flippase
MSEIEKDPPEMGTAEDLAEPVEPADVISAEKPKQQSVARSAGIVSIAVMFSRVLGLVREQVFAYYFGAGFLNDAFQLAFRIPNVLRDLFAEGALSAAFVKVFTDYQINRTEKEAWRLASLVLNALAIVLSVITIIGVIFFPSIRRPDRGRLLAGKSRTRDNADADNVPLYLARRARRGGDGRAEH